MIDVVRARMRRRLLLTYRVAPEVAREIIPAPFRPQLVRGSAVGGLCLIRLDALRPAWVAPPVGGASENVAHRFAVEWDEDGETRQGVYVTQRHSSSLLATLGGGRLFPGVQHRAHIEAEESDARFRVRMSAPGVSARADIEAADVWHSELFDTVGEASDFYRAGTVGWSPRPGGGADAVSLQAEGWAVVAGRVHGVASSFFDRMPTGAAAFDSALIMRDLPVTWRRERPATGVADRSARPHESQRFTAVAPSP